MAWHKIGNSYLSDREVNTRGQELYFLIFDIGLPGLLTYFGVGLLMAFMAQFNFFIVHTTTAKLTYIVAGLFMFAIAYAIRKLVLVLAVLSIVGYIGYGIAGDFLHWLFK